MGYERHHAIVVSGFDAKRVRSARRKAKQIGLAVSTVVESPLNGIDSFFVAPDGSKEGWEDSDKGDALRNEFLEHLDGLRYSDGGSPLDWIAVQYGDDERIAKVVAHSDEVGRRMKARREAVAAEKRKKKRRR